SRRDRWRRRENQSDSISRRATQRRLVGGFSTAVRRKARKFVLNRRTALPSSLMSSYESSEPSGRLGRAVLYPAPNGGGTTTRIRLPGKGPVPATSSTADTPHPATGRTCSPLRGTRPPAAVPRSLARRYSRDVRCRRRR